MINMYHSLIPLNFARCTLAAHRNRYVRSSPEGHFPPGGIFHVERHFLLFKDQLAESMRQKIKENIIPRGKFHLVENDP